MKNIWTRFAFLILVFHCYSISAQVRPEQLIGTWVFDYSKSIDKIDEQAQKDYALMPEVIKSQFEQSYRGRKLIFNTNGSFIQQTIDGKQIVGSWKLDNNQNISVTSPQGGTIAFKLVVLSDAILVLQLQKKGNQQIILSQWYLNKN